MVAPVIVAGPETTLADVARLMLEHRIGCVPIVDATGGLVGIVTESDFAAKDRGIPFSTFRWPQVLGQWLPKEGLERIYEAARSTTAQEVMSTELIAIADTTPIEEVVRQMLERNLRHIPVVQDGQLVGIITRHELLSLMLSGQVLPKKE